MKPRPLPKPIWYQYAEQVRKQLDERGPGRGDGSQAEMIMEGFAEAKRSKGYQGSFTDWTDLLTRIKRGRIRT